MYILISVSYKGKENGPATTKIVPEPVSTVNPDVIPSTQSIPGMISTIAPSIPGDLIPTLPVDFPRKALVTNVYEGLGEPSDPFLRLRVGNADLIDSKCIADSWCSALE